MSIESDNFVDIINRQIERGFYMIPLVPGKKIPAVEDFNGENNTNDIDVVRDCLADQSELNFGVLCGKKSNLLVIDIDGHHGGYESIKTKSEEIGELPETYTVATPSGGQHKYYKYPETEHNKLGPKVGVIQGVDIRCEGSYVVGAGSRIGAGKYNILNDVDIAVLPKQWVDFIYGKAVVLGYRTKINGEILKLIKGSGFQLPTSIGKGERNSVLQKYACSLLGKGNEMERIAKKVKWANENLCEEPLTESEIDNTILKSVNRYKEEIEQNEYRKKEQEKIPRTDSIEYVPYIPDMSSEEASQTLSIMTDMMGASENTEIPENKYFKVDKNGIVVGIYQGMYAQKIIHNDYKGNIYCVNGQLQDFDNNWIDDSIIRSECITTLCNYQISGNQQAISEGVLKILKDYTKTPCPEPVSDVIYLNNRKLIKWDSKKKRLVEGTRKTLAAKIIDLDIDLFDVYDETYEPLKKAKLLKKWLDGALTKEDQITIQEFIGYCLTSSTDAQKALFLVGAGGEGKSRIADIIMSLIGKDSISNTQLGKLDGDGFNGDIVENKLVIYDDDVSDKALEDTGYIKSLITSSGLELTLNKKYQAKFKVVNMAKVVCCSNHLPNACYDRTDGFTRRFIPIKCKRVNPNRENILPIEFAKAWNGVERDAMIVWALRGLHRVYDQNYKFTLSDTTMETTEEMKNQNNNVKLFMEDCENISYNTKYAGTAYAIGKHSAIKDDLYSLYQMWCANNEHNSYKRKTFFTELELHFHKAGLPYKDITTTDHNGKRRVAVARIRILSDREVTDMLGESDDDYVLSGYDNKIIRMIK